VWVAARFTEEHRSTLDWLNRITDYHFRFFGLEIELWRIGTSPAAPKFTIVSKPDDWSPLARAAPAIEDLESAKNRGAQRPSGSFSFAEQTAPAIEDPEPAENWVAQNPSESFSLAELAEPTKDPEPVENRGTQRPSEWSSFAEQAAPGIEDPEPAETQKRMQRAYWTAFDKVLRTSGGPVGGGKKPQPQSWMAYSVGRSHFLLMAAMLRLNRRVRAELYISGEKAKAHFHMLKSRKEEIEANLGYALDWEEMPAEKNSRVSVSLNNANPENEADWPRQHRWLAQHLNEMHRALSPWIAAVDDLATLVAEKEEVVKVAKDSGLSTRAFAVYRKLRDDEVIRNAGIAARELAQETESLLELYPDIQVDADEQRQLRASLGRLLLGLDKKERVRVVDTVLGILLDDVAKIETQGSFRDLPVNELRVAPLVLPRAS
jgi:hypothetical protein